MVTEIVNLLADIFENLNKTNSLDQAIDEIKMDKRYNKNILATAFSWIYEKQIRDIGEELEHEAINYQRKANIIQ